MMKKILSEGAPKLQIELSDKQIEKFVKYYNLVVEYNKNVNLTAITDETEFAIKHFLDSISAEKYIPKNSSVVDVGSGAGFPALPLKLVRDDVSVTMMDALNKRVEFLKLAIKELDVWDVSAIHMRAEDAAKGIFRESFDVAVARAVSELRVLAEYCLPLVKIGGIMIAYKSVNSDEETDAAQNALKILGGKIEKTVDLQLPTSGDMRRLIIIRKVSATPKKYPRGQGKEKKQPL